MLLSARYVLVIACLLTHGLGEDLCQTGSCLHRNLCRREDSSRRAKCIPGTVFCCQAKSTLVPTRNATGVINHQEVSQEVSQLQPSLLDIHHQHSSHQTASHQELDIHSSPNRADIQTISNTSAKPNRTSLHRLYIKKPATPLPIPEIGVTTTQAPLFKHTNQSLNKNKFRTHLNVTKTVELPKHTRNNSENISVEASKPEMLERSHAKRSLSSPQEVVDDSTVSKSIEDYRKELAEYRKRRMEYELLLKDYVDALEESGYELIEGKVVKKSHFPGPVFRQAIQENSMNYISDTITLGDKEAEISVIRNDGRTEIVKLQLQKNAHSNDNENSQDITLLLVNEMSKLLRDPPNKEVETVKFDPKIQDIPNQFILDMKFVEAPDLGNPGNKSPDVADDSLDEPKQSISEVNAKLNIIRMNQHTDRLSKKTFIKRRRPKDKSKTGSAFIVSDFVMMRDGMMRVGTDRLRDSQDVNSLQEINILQSNNKGLNGIHMTNEGIGRGKEMVTLNSEEDSLPQHKGGSMAGQDSRWESRREVKGGPSKRSSPGSPQALSPHHPSLHHYLQSHTQ